MNLSALVIAFAVAFGLALGACSSDDAQGPEEQNAPAAGAPAGSNDPRDPQQEILPDPLEGLSKGQEQLTKLCARGARNKVTQALCSNPSVGSVVQLQQLLGLGFRDRSANGTNGGGGNPAFALLGHSSSLVARSVSAINPRAFVFTPPPGRPQRLPGWVVMGFARGETFVEIAAEDQQTRNATFYLLKFEIACEATHSCKPGDLLTPAVEKNWTGWSLYDDEDLKNTIVDCRHCHQPGGPSTRPMLRMQELEDPWTHWFRSDRPGGAALIADYRKAHGDREDYFGIPAALISSSDGLAMEDFVVGQGFGDQPNVFDTVRIENEVKSSSRSQPEINMPKGRSQTWQRLYDASFSGQFIPPPYHDVKVTDPTKLAFATEQYVKVSKGSMPAADLPDIRRVFLDDALWEMTMRPKPGASGREILVQMCAQCHNPKLDPALSRARFDVTALDTMAPAMKQNAIARLRLPASDRKHMPPAVFRTLPEDALKLAIDELSK